MAANTVYRFYDEHERLLYVGISFQLTNRFKAHQREKPWWTDAVRITLEHHPDRKSAKAAETKAIKTENPVHNVSEDERTPEERAKDQSVWGLLCELEPRLAELERDVHEGLLCLEGGYFEDEIMHRLYGLVGWGRSLGPYIVPDSDEPADWGESIDRVFDGMGRYYRRGIDHSPSAELLMSKAAWLCASQHLLDLAEREWGADYRWIEPQESDEE